MPAAKYTFQLRSALIGSANDAYVDFDMNVPAPGVLDSDAIVAQCAAYLRQSGGLSAQTSIIGCKVSIYGGVQGVQYPWPTATWDALAATNALPVGFTYGDTFGGGSLLPVGTSMLVQERTATPGRSGRGRHFLPFIGGGTLAANGQFFQASCDQAVTQFRKFILGVGLAAPGVALTPVVVSKVTGGVAHAPTFAPITSVTANIVPSSLASRRR